MTQIRYFTLKVTLRSNRKIVKIISSHNFLPTSYPFSRSGGGGGDGFLPLQKCPFFVSVWFQMRNQELHQFWINFPSAILIVHPWEGNLYVPTGVPHQQKMRLSAHPGPPLIQPLNPAGQRDRHSQLDQVQTVHLRQSFIFQTKSLSRLLSKIPINLFTYFLVSGFGF